jgi:PhnB protein
MQVQSYLNFDGRSEEAIEFYRKALDAKLEMMMRFKESPEPPPPGMVPPGSENKIMHAAFRIGDTQLFASDMASRGKPVFQGITLSLLLGSDAEATRCFTALAEGGKVEMALSKTFFASSFGTVTDKFGVSWMVLAGMQEPPR